MTVADRPAGRSLADLARSGDQRHLAMPARMIGSFCRISLWSKTPPILSSPWITTSLRNDDLKSSAAEEFENHLSGPTNFFNDT